VFASTLNVPRSAIAFFAAADFGFTIVPSLHFCRPLFAPLIGSIQQPAPLPRH
jgi:hypothetical protein